MHTGRFVFAQLLDFLPKHAFDRCVQHYRGNHRYRTLSCYDQFLCMAFAQLTYRESLRDVVTCLHALKPKLFHAGIRGSISRSTLADANEKRDWRIYADFARILISQARRLYADEALGVELEASVYALDSTVIDLCLSVFPWARFKTTKAAVKLHTLLDLRGQIPTVIHISDAKLHDSHVLDLLVPEPGAFYIVDRGYLDFERLHGLHRAAAFFVTRTKANLRYARRYSRPVEKSTGLRCDQTVVLAVRGTRASYPDALRRVAYRDPEGGQTLDFLTNNFLLPALDIARLYRARWNIELFFKWIKQHLRIKAFYGTTPNAVKTQIWIAVCVYVLIAIVKKRLALPHSLYTILQILSITLFEKTPILQAFSQFDYTNDGQPDPNQLTLFDF